MVEEWLKYGIVVNAIATAFFPTGLLFALVNATVQAKTVLYK